MTYEAYLDLLPVIEGKRSYAYFFYQSQALLSLCGIITKAQQNNLRKEIQKRLVYQTEDGPRLRSLKVLRTILIEEYIKISQ